MILNYISLNNLAVKSIHLNLQIFNKILFIQNFDLSPILRLIQIEKK